MSEPSEWARREAEALLPCIERPGCGVVHGTRCPASYRESVATALDVVDELVAWKEALRMAAPLGQENGGPDELIAAIRRDAARAGEQRLRGRIEREVAIQDRFAEHATALRDRRRHEYTACVLRGLLEEEE